MTVLAPASRKAARGVGRRAHLVENLEAYPSAPSFGWRRLLERPRWRKIRSLKADLRWNRPTTSQVEQIENRILIRELLRLSRLSIERFFLRSLDGKTCPEIDSAMHLKPRTAEIRIAFCKSALRKALQEKLDRRT